MSVLKVKTNVIYKPNVATQKEGTPVSVNQVMMGTVKPAKVRLI